MTKILPLSVFSVILPFCVSFGDTSQSCTLNLFCDDPVDGGFDGNTKDEIELLKDEIRELRETVDGLESCCTSDKPTFPDSRCFMGLKSGTIPDSAIYASSIWSAGYEATRARLDTHHGQPGIAGSWVAGKGRNQNNLQWIQVEFEEAKSVAGVITQGREDSDQWVKSFKVLCAINYEEFEEVMSLNSGPIFRGNSDRNTYVVNKFASVQTCRYVRINPQTWNNRMAMRFELVDGKCYDDLQQ